MASEHDWIGEALTGLPGIVTTEEAAALLRMGKRNLYRLLAAGRIKSVKQAEAGSSRVLIPRSSLESYLRSLDPGSRRAAS